MTISFAIFSRPLSLTIVGCVCFVTEVVHVWYRRGELEKAGSFGNGCNCWGKLEWMEVNVLWAVARRRELDGG